MSKASISSSITVGISANDAGARRLSAPSVARGPRRGAGSADGHETRNLVCNCKSSTPLEAGVR